MPGKQIRVPHALHGGTVFGNSHPRRTGYEGTHQVRVGKVMLAQQDKRFMVARINQALDISGDCCSRRIVRVILQHVFDDCFADYAVSVINTKIQRGVTIQLNLLAIQ
jgi:hypothetical protein